MARTLLRAAPGAGPRVRHHRVGGVPAGRVVHPLRGDGGLGGPPRAVPPDGVDRHPAGAGHEPGRRVHRAHPRTGAERRGVPAVDGSVPAGQPARVRGLHRGRGPALPWSLAWACGVAGAGRAHGLTHYILQSVLGTLCFYGYGFGHWGMPRAQQLVYVLVVFALQVLLSRWWLSVFRFGPLEWAWRWATYGRRPPMRIADA
ncbi:MAG: DUF418 domain-containing protein [Lysobacteraceae bacterium]|nr:MAG: DUF418 domain-containing protein [Xanthomonadaceae bacterium]